MSDGQKYRYEEEVKNISFKAFSVEEKF